MLTVLSVAYALAPVGPDAVGGAEQVLSALDAALVAVGHRSIVVACRGSSVAGEWVDTGVVTECARVDDGQRAAERATRDAAQAVLARTHVDVVHMHGLDFATTQPATDVPALVTLHLPPPWYADLDVGPATWLTCVSATQERACLPHPRLLPFIGNGVPVERLAAGVTKRRFAVTLGRVCPEKGQHLALRAARLAGMPLLVGGAVFPYPAHQAYFDDEVAPLLARERRFLGPVGFERKRRLLAAASCVLLPSLAPETSSLVAMEALAAGTPVIAYPSGALAEIVEDGRTGFLVRDVDEMAAATRRVGEIDPGTCRAAARERFGVTRMTQAYLDRYRRLAQGAGAIAA